MLESLVFFPSAFLNERRVQLAVFRLSRVVLDKWKALNNNGCDEKNESTIFLSSGVHTKPKPKVLSQWCTPPGKSIVGSFFRSYALLFSASLFGS